MEENRRTKELIDRVQQMEQYLDELLAISEQRPLDWLEDTEVCRKIQILKEYMEDGQWLLDFEASERGELPKGIKCGVLSEDALYNLLWDIKELRKLTVENNSI